MIYAYIHGRLGNQFFQYAFAKKLSLLRHDKIILDFSDVYRMAQKYPDDGWENSLQYFNLNKEVIFGKRKLNRKECLLLSYFKIFSKIYRLWDSTPQSRRKFEESNIKRFSNNGILIATGYYEYENLTQEDIILDGYFESPKYFNDIEQVIKNEFMPKYPLIRCNTSLWNEIVHSESICVTIRRGDFVKNKEISKVANICNQEFFYKGINYIKKLIPNAKVFVFSDDIDWVRTNMRFPDETKFESGKDPVWEKMRLMSACKHFVISNSTFSWWAQYLSNNNNKIVVAPDRWRKGIYDDVALYDKNWVLLKV